MKIKCSTFEQLIDATYKQCFNLNIEMDKNELFFTTEEIGQDSVEEIKDTNDLIEHMNEFHQETTIKLVVRFGEDANL